jgi:cell division transport system permease protein
MARLLRYAFDEATASLWRARRSSLLSTATIAIALFVLGAFLVVTANLERLADQWSGAAELSVYLADDISDADRAALEGDLRADPAVERVDYVDKRAALARFTQTFPDLAATFDTVHENPLPASFDVRLRASWNAQSSLDPLVARLRGAAGVSDVRYDKEWLDRLTRGVRMLRLIGFALGGALIAAAALTIANVVRLALNARRDEVDIMHLVGAPQAYVRGPFVMEGALHGGIGALAALIALALAFAVARPRLLAPLAQALNLTSVAFLSAWAVLSMVIGGVAVGCLAGLLASRRA